MVKIRINKRTISLSCVFIFALAFFGNIDFKVSGMTVPIIGAVYIYPLLCVLMAGWCLIYISKRIDYDSSMRIIFLLLCLILWGAVLTIINGEYEQGFSSLMSYIYLFLSIVVLRVFLNEKDKIISWLFGYWFSAVLLAFLGIYEAFTGNFIHEASGLYLYSISDFGLFFPKTVFYNINDMAVAMTFAFLISWFGFTCVFPNKPLKFFSAILFAIVILLGESRGAVYSIALFIIIVIFRKLKFRQLINWLIIFCLVAFVLLFTNGFMTLIEKTGRALVWSKSIMSLADSHFLGAGPGMIVIANEAQGYSGTVNAVHNYSLEVICEFGIIGLIYIITCYITMWSSYGKMKTAVNSCEGIINSSSYYLKAIFVCFLLVSITSSSLVNKTFFISFFSFMVVVGTAFKNFD